MGRSGRTRSIRQWAGVAFAAWAIVFSLLAIAAAKPGGPTASLSVDDIMPDVGQVVHFDASDSVGHDNGQGRIVSYRFDFGDRAATQDQTSPTASHAYSMAVPMRASVTVRDLRGNEGSAIVTIDVQPKPPPTGGTPDLAPKAAFTMPAKPIEGDLVSLSITIVNRGSVAAEAATIDVSDVQPNGTIVSIGTTSLTAPLEPGDTAIVYSRSFTAVGVGDHELQINIQDVMPAETDVQDNMLTIRMTVLPVMGPPPPPNQGFSLNTALIIGGLVAAAVAAVLIAAWLLLTPREPGPLEPPPAEPLDESPPPIRPP